MQGCLPSEHFMLSTSLWVALRVRTDKLLAVFLHLVKYASVEVDAKHDVKRGDFAADFGFGSRNLSHSLRNTWKKRVKRNERRRGE